MSISYHRGEGALPIAKLAYMLQEDGNERTAGIEFSDLKGKVKRHPNN